MLLSLQYNLKYHMHAHSKYIRPVSSYATLGGGALIRTDLRHAIHLAYTARRLKCPNQRFLFKSIVSVDKGHQTVVDILLEANPDLSICSKNCKRSPLKTTLDRQSRAWLKKAFMSTFNTLRVEPLSTQPVLMADMTYRKFCWKQMQTLVFAQMKRKHPL